MVLGYSRLKIQQGLGSGNITIEEVDPSKTIVLSSTFNVAYGDGATVVNTNQHATLINSKTINCTSTTAWTVIEFGGAI